MSATSPPPIERSHVLCPWFDGALVAGLLTVTFLFGCFEMWNVDIWWHLRTGELIAERMGESPWPWDWVPQRDWYTFTNADRRWIDLHWGFQLAAAAVHHCGGVPLLVLCKAALGVAAVGICLLARRRRWSPTVTVACWLPALIVLSGRLYVRPEIFTLVCLAVFLAVLFHAAERPRLLWLLPLVQLLWVNSQGLFAFGLVVLASYWVDWVLRAASQRWWSAKAGGTAGLSDSHKEEVATTDSLRAAVDGKSLLAVTVLVLAACFVNPYTWRGVVFPLELYQRVGSERQFFAGEVGELRGVGDFLSDAIDYWRERDSIRMLLNPYLLAHLLTLILGAVSFAVLVVAGRRVDAFRLLLFAGFAYLGWQARRNNNHFALVAGFVTASNFAEAWWHQAQRRKHETDQRAGCAIRAVVAWVLAVLAWLVVALGLVVLAWLIASDRFYAWAGAGRKFGIGQRQNWYPHGAAQFAGRAGMPRLALVTNWGHAGVYIFHNAPERRVLMDGRLEVNTRETMELYNRILEDLASGGERWEALLREAVDRAGPLAEAADESGNATSMAAVRMPALVIEVAESRRWILEQRLPVRTRLDLAGPVIKNLVNNPRWRCVYCDRVGAVFLEAQRAEQFGLKPAGLAPIFELTSDE